MEYHYATKEGALILKEYKKGLEVVSYEGEDIYLTIPGAVPAEHHFRIAVTVRRPKDLQHTGIPLSQPVLLPAAHGRKQ